MKISIDAQPLVCQNKSGIGYYGHNLLLELSKNEKTKLVLEFFAFRHSKEKIACAEQYCAGNVALDACVWFTNRIYLLLTAVLPISRSFFFSNSSDANFYFNYILPPGVHGKKVVVVHDMVFRDCPETASLKTRFLLTLFLKRSLKRADRIVTVSEFSKQRIQNYYGIPDERISIVPCGVDIEQYHPLNDISLIDSVKAKYNIDGEYFFYLGTLEPRKNILNLIRAYEMFIKGRNKFPKLVLSGGNGWLFDEIFEYVDKSGLNEQVVFTGYIDDADKVPLLCGAELFCFPSLYEGFGIPILEAMACGTPVLTADSSSLPEVGGNACEYCDPTSVESICDSLKTLWDDPQRRNVLSAAGLEQSKKFSWKASAQKLTEIFCSLTEEQNGGTNESP